MDSEQLLTLAVQVEQYDPAASPDNRADELALHQDIVMATGIGTLSPAFEATFLRSLDVAMGLLSDGYLQLHVTADHAEALASTGSWVKAATAPLAVCAASLRARELSPSLIFRRAGEIAEARYPLGCSSATILSGIVREVIRAILEKSHV